MTLFSPRLRGALACVLLLGTLLPASAQSALQAALGGAPADPAVVRTEQVRAELLAHAPQGIAPGQPLWLGLQLTHQPGWHTYWKNPGDSGLPTQLDWQLPAGVTAGEIAWPTPRKFPLGNLANYGYEGTVLLPVPVTLPTGFAAERLDVRLKASWLACRRECIPQEGEFTLQLPTRGSLALHAAAFDAALAAQPQPLPAQDSRITVQGQTLQLRLQGLPAAARGQRLGFFPETASIIEPAGAWTQAWQGSDWTATVPLSAMRSEAPERLPVVVALASGEKAWRIEAPVTGSWPAVAPLPGVSPALEAALKANAEVPPPRNLGGIGLLAALLGALAGGLILNLMPCVFPVLAIKVLAFAQHADDRRVHRSNGLAYTAGVLLSFLALGGLLLGLRAAGEQLGWGFQLQSPGVVAALAVLFTLLGLNLAGLFEFGQVLPSRVASLKARHPTADAFLTGVLATAIASPCTAPFMGASLGLAIGLPATQALAVFGALGLGMALPYLLASWVPAVARGLPRPGAWMQTFRQLMAFPMFATVVWLLWVLGQQSGINGAAALLMLLVALALLVWALGLQGRSRPVLASLSLAGLFALGWAVGPHVTRLQETPSATTALPDTPGATWQAWSPERQAELLAQGRPVFIDFTAAWCVTCQYNKHNALADEAVLAELRAKGVTLLRADWTRRDPAVTAALASLGRNGVPVYALLAPGKAPVLLSEILSAGEVRQAISLL